MIILFGSTGYIGSEFKKQLNTLNIPILCWKNTSNTTFKDLERWYESVGYPIVDLVINAAGYIGVPNVDVAEYKKEELIFGNVVWPTMLTDWCMMNEIPLGHISSGCIYTGKKENGEGFSEEDEPNFNLKYNNSSFYSGTKSLCEGIVSKWEKSYIWRLRMPFEETDNNRNYLSKLLKYETLLNCENSITNKNEFVTCCIESFKKKIPYGKYNIINSGSVTTEFIVNVFKKTICKNKNFKIIDESEFYKNKNLTPRSSCVLSNKKLLSTGIKIRNVEDAVEYCLENWKFN